MTDLRQAAQAVVNRWDTLSWSWSEKTPTASLMAALRAALEQQAEPTQWRDMVVVNLVREGINKHKARELADHFATPPAAQRPWVGLEAKDLAQIESDEFWQVGNHMAIAMAVEAKLKERNT